MLDRYPDLKAPVMLLGESPCRGSARSPDPVDGGLAEFERTYERIATSARRWLNCRHCFAMRRYPGADLFDAFSPAYRGPGQGVVGRSARFGLPDDAAQDICPDAKIVLNSKSIAHKKNRLVIATGQRCATSANHCSGHACFILITLWGCCRQAGVGSKTDFHRESNSRNAVCSSP